MAESNLTQENYVIDNRGPDTKTTDAYTSGTWKAPEGYKDLLILLLLILVTFGIYMLYWIYKMTEFMNNDDRFEKKKNPWIQMLLCIIPVYFLAWVAYIQSGLNVWGEDVGLTKKSFWYNYPIWFLGCQFIIVLYTQNYLNKILCIKNGATFNATGQGTCKNCHATFPNDAEKCPNCGTNYKKSNLRQILLYLLVTITALAIVGLAIYGYINDDTDTSSSSYTSEETIDPAELSTELKKDSDGKLALYDSDGNVLNLYSGLVEKDEDWYYVENGYVNTEYIGIILKDNEVWYVENGKFKPDANGPISFKDGDKVTIKNGKVIEGEFTAGNGEHIKVSDGIVVK